MVMMLNFENVCGEFSVVRICTDGNSIQKWNIKLYNYEFIVVVSLFIWIEAICRTARTHLALIDVN
jgi:hypothetical protein